ncbi:MAG: acetylxylan esterase, partial [Chloroflexota bacterium]
ETEVFENLGYIDIQHLSHLIKSKTKWFIGLSDQICPPSTQFAAYNKITAEKSMEMFPDFGHEDLPGHHDIIFEFMMAL